MALTGKVYGKFTLEAGANWNFWFYPNNGAYQSSSTIDWDPTNLYLVPRPWVNDSWDVQSIQMIVVLEVNSSNPPQYRHSYRLNVKNAGTVKQTFFIAASELKP